MKHPVLGLLALILVSILIAVILSIQSTHERKSTMSAGIIELTDSNFEAETQSGVVLIDFWAPWCGPCRMQTPILEQIAGQVDGAKIAKLNVDEAPAVAAKFGVQSIPTLVVLKDGQPVKQMIGVQQADTLVAALNAAK